MSAFQELPRASEVMGDFFDHVIVPPVAGTEGGDAQPVLGLIAGLADKLPQTRFTVFVTRDHGTLVAAAGLNSKRNVQIMTLNASLKEAVVAAPSHTPKLQQWLDKVRQVKNIGATYYRTAYKSFTPQLKAEYQAALTQIDYDPQRTLFVSHQGSYAYLPADAVHWQFATPYFLFNPESGLISQAVGVLWEDSKFAALRTALIKAIFSSTIGKGGGSIDQLTKDSITQPLVMAHEQVMPRASSKRLQRAMREVLIGQVRPVDADPSATGHTLATMERLKEEGYKVAFFSVGSSINQSTAELQKLAEVFNTRLSSQGDVWKILVQTTDPEVTEYLQSQPELFEVCDYAHYPTLLHPNSPARPDLLLVSGGLGTAHEVLASGLPAMMLSLPNLLDQKDTGELLADKFAFIDTMAFTDLAKMSVKELADKIELVLLQNLEPEHGELAEIHLLRKKQNQTDPAQLFMNAVAHQLMTNPKYSL